MTSSGAVVMTKLMDASIYRNVRPWVDAISQGTREHPSHSLMVVVSVVGAAFNFDFRYRKELWDSLSQSRAPATTWTNGMTGKHGGDASFILHGLSEVAGIFVREYLSVNEDAC